MCLLGKGCGGPAGGTSLVGWPRVFSDVSGAGARGLTDRGKRGTEAAWRLTRSAFRGTAQEFSQRFIHRAVHPEPVHAGEILKIAQMFSRWQQVSRLLCFPRTWRSQCFASITSLHPDSDWGSTWRVVSPPTRVTDEEVEARATQLERTRA